MSTPTIRVRAAVAISGHDPANWIVAGSRLQSDDEIVDLISGCSGIQTPSFRTAFPEPPHTP